MTRVTSGSSRPRCPFWAPYSSGCVAILLMRRAAGIRVDRVQGALREDRPGRARVRDVRLHVSDGLSPVEIRDPTRPVNALADGRVGLEPQPVPPLHLPDENESERARGVHLRVQQLS